MTSPLEDMCNQLVREYREELPRADAAMFDLAVGLELKRRGLASAELAQILRLRAEEHRRQVPLIWSLMRQLADNLSGTNVVTLPLPGAKP